ncbi:MAG: hypothetical protein ACN2B6_08150 [Rickettsiales bacterium]
MVERRRPQEGTGSQGPKPADKSKLPPLEERREHTIEPGTTNEQAQAANASSTDDVVADLERAVRDKKSRVEAPAPAISGDRKKTIGLADSNAGDIKILEDKPEPEQPKADSDTVAGLTQLFTEKFAEQAKGDKKSLPEKPRVQHIPVDAMDKSDMFIVLSKKANLTNDKLEAMGFGEKPKVKRMKVETWNVSATIMKNFVKGIKSDVEPEKMEPSEVGELIRNKGKNKPSDFTGMEFASVSGDWDKGFTISNVVGASRTAIFGKEDGSSIDKEVSDKSEALVVSEKNMRDAMTGKNQTKTYKRDELTPEIPEGGLDMASLIAAERSAQGVMQEDHSPVVNGKGSSGGFLKRLLGGQGGGKGGSKGR